MVAPRAISCGVEAERELFPVRVSDSAQLFKRFITGRILIRQPIEGCPGSRNPFLIQALTTRLA
jgi:hypothetical protein